jgi:CRISPR-associated protein Cst2
MNLFATVLTYCQPSANYRGESELNRSVIQKVTDGRFDYPIISPEAMRNALREILAGKYKLSCNRERLPDEEQLAVRFNDYPDPDKYADDCAPRRLRGRLQERPGRHAA